MVPPQPPLLANASPIVITERLSERVASIAKALKELNPVIVVFTPKNSRHDEEIEMF